MGQPPAPNTPGPAITCNFRAAKFNSQRNHADLWDVPVTHDNSS
jgi:hypothetical protein